LSPLSSIFGLVVRTRNALYDRGVIRPRRLRGPVISVGNLSLGGSGKTPFVILLGELLKSRGIPFDVLSRGYGRATRGVLAVDGRGSAREFGDEPLLLMRRLEVPVMVGEDRHLAGIAAESKFGPQVHLLDDGFQHRALARDFDIVLLTGEDVNDRLLPGGRLREPLSSWRRADAVVLTDTTDPEPYQRGGGLVWRIRRGLSLQIALCRPVVFCGIARPAQFLAQLRSAGVEPAAEAVYGDHHAYSERDVDDLLKLRERSGSEGFVTTEKDAVNLGSLISALQPMTVPRVTMELVDSSAALDRMLRTIEQRRQLA
jgi:tetraacyldisaccharide 4'-kinase